MIDNSGPRHLRWFQGKRQISNSLSEFCFYDSWHVIRAYVILAIMSDVTRILIQIEHGDTAAAEQLLPLVYTELRKLAGGHMTRESPDHTLTATALVHEAYIRLLTGVGPR